MLDNNHERQTSNGMNPEENIKKETSYLPPIRTYKGDVTESIKSGRQSFAGMVMAEGARREQAGASIPTQETAPQRKKILFIVGGVLFALFAASIIIFLFLGSEADAPETLPTIPAWNPIFTEIDKSAELNQFTENELKNRLEEAKRNTAIPIGAVLHVALMKLAEGPTGRQEIPITVRELFSALPNDIPPQLLRTLNDSFFVGFHSFRTIAPVLIMQNRFYDGAFLGMLEWERFMLNDLAPLFLVPPVNQQRLFEDLIIKNIDIRALKNASGEIILLYSFIDRETIVITTNTETFGEIVNRLRTPRTITR